MALGVVNGPGNGFRVSSWDIVAVLGVAVTLGWFLRDQKEKSNLNLV